MTNLPISNANILPPGNAPTGLPQDSATGQDETTFASLLEQQIDAAATGEVENAQTVAPTAIALEEVIPEAGENGKPDGKGELNIVQDPAGAMAALLLQLPDRPDATLGELRGQGANALAHAAGIALERASPQSRLAREALAQTEAAPAQADSRADMPKAGFAAQLQQDNAAALQQVVSEPTPAAIVSASPSLEAPSNVPQMAAPPAQLLPATAALATDSQKAITTPLTSDQWPNDFSQKINWMISGREQMAELHLNPPDLGPLNVVLKVSDNQATALFTSPHGAVREAVENALPKLREILADNGITLGNASVSDQPRHERDARAPSERDQGAGSPPHSEPNELPLAAAQLAPLRRHHGMVDTFA